MEEFSLYVLDITMNSVRAGASEIDVMLEESGDILTFTVKDNGCGMSEEMVKNLSDPFFTTRKTRKVGLGIPFLKMLATNTGGDVTITSKSEHEHPDDHGTVIRSTFNYKHIDFIPVGDIKETFISLVQGYPDTDFTFTVTRNGESVRLSCREVRDMLGGSISLAEYEVLSWMRDYLSEGLSEIGL